MSIAALNNSPHLVPAQADDLPKPFTVKSVTQDVALTKSFHTNPRWSGADGACSVPLDEDTSVWLFGDTFIRKEGAEKPLAASKSQKHESASNFEFINNTVAVQKLSTGGMKFYWRDLHRSPCAVMAPKSMTRSYYWPGDGFVLDEKLFIVNKVIVPKPLKQEGDFGFEWKSDDLSMVTNAGSPPTKWQWKTSALPEHAKTALMGTALLLKDDYAFFYMSLQKFAVGTNVHPTGVARISNRALLSMDMSKFEFWNGKTWVSNIGESSVIIEDGASEMTVTKLNGEPYLVATYMAPMSADICMRFSKKPEGPWTNPVKIYQCPEHQEKVFGRRTAVYSAKAHPELSSKKDEVVVTYCSNPGEMKHYLSRPDLYYPRALRVKLSPTAYNEH
ncbi:MAG: DUF4185 domain-containing protein [Cyanobacteria bacterium SZAS-4]|nr:DUF4185 domain-containing protein [Cyanobacteria bacterium SZAS-4]